MSAVVGGRPVDLPARRHYHRAPMSPPDDRQRVLIVEDEPNIASFARMYLEAAGFEVSLAARGDDGLRMAEDESPSLVILDLMLPGMDGYEVTKRLRQKGHTPIIMLTARDDAVNKVVGLELGADDYITKPFNPRELVARVRAVLRRAETRPPGVGPAASRRRSSRTACASRSAAARCSSRARASR